MPRALIRQRPRVSGRRRNNAEILKWNYDIEYYTEREALEEQDKTEI